MRSSGVRRIGVVIAPVALAAMVLGACGSDESSEATRTTVALNTGSTAFVVKPPESTTTLPEGITEDGVVPGEQEYVVQSGDYPLKVADQFGVPLEDLVNYNGWASANEFPFPGNTIKIPPGGNDLSAAGAADDASDAATGDGTEAAGGDDAGATVGDTIPEAGDNCGEGTHTVAEGDIPIRIAEQYDVTLEALAAANAGNPAYNQFIPGQEIIIPAKADC